MAIRSLCVYISIKIPVGKIAKKAVCLSVFLTMSAEQKLTSSDCFFWRFCLLGGAFSFYRDYCRKRLFNPLSGNTPHDNDVTCVGKIIK